MSPRPPPIAEVASGGEPSPPAPSTFGGLAQLGSYLEFERVPAIVLDRDYRIVSANPAYLRQFGLQGANPRGQTCYRVSHHYSVPCDQAGEHCPMRRAIETGAPDRVLHVHHTPRGQEHVDVELRPLKDAAGDIVGFVERLHTLRNASVQPRDEGLVGRSATFNRALAALHRAAPSDIPVMLLGESGTGKELFAQALHRASRRADGPLVVVDCTGLTETLFESELFGHERGAFTGANARKVGLVETAHGGTLFLDEIGDVPLTTQVKLLRLIESGTFRRVGGVETLSANFRLVTATHKPLRQMVEDGQFRRDLYYRINAFPVHLPALRERVEDIPLLAESLLARSGGQRVPSISPEAMRLLCAYDYPGNVRELRNILERACLFADSGVIRPQDLPDELQRGPALPPPERAGRGLAEKARLSRALAEFDGTRAELATQLGLSERTLYRRLKQHGLA